jgi:hypothetical protein
MKLRSKLFQIDAREQAENSRAKREFIVFACGENAKIVVR